MALRAWGNNKDSEFVQELETAYDNVSVLDGTGDREFAALLALRKLIPRTLQELRRLEREIIEAKRPLAMDGPADECPVDEIPLACQEDVGRALARICFLAFRAGWDPEIVYASIHEWTTAMAEFDRKAMGERPFGEQYRVDAGKSGES